MVTQLMLPSLFSFEAVLSCGAANYAEQGASNFGVLIKSCYCDH